MLGGTGNVTLNASDVMTGGCDGVRRAAFEFEGSDFEDRVVTLVRNKFFGVEEQVVESLRREIAGRRNLEERKLF
jgi:hypothetical protein